MSNQAVEYRTAGFGSLFGATRKLRLDSSGLTYHGPDQDLRLNWTEIHALVAAGVVVPSDGRSIEVPAVGICLRVPFAHPTLVDGVMPNLDYAIPVADLAKMPLLMTVSADQVLAQAAIFAKAAGVSIVDARTARGLA